MATVAAYSSLSEAEMLMETYEEENKQIKKEKQLLYSHEKQRWQSSAEDLNT